MLGPHSPRNILEEAIACQERAVRDLLSPLDPRSATLAWLDTIRAIEETVNLVTVDWEPGLVERLYGLPVLEVTNYPDHLRVVRAALEKRFSTNHANRFVQLMLQLSALGIAFINHGLIEIAQNFVTLASTIGYLQSRRRACVSLLIYLPNACKGRAALGTLDPVVTFFPLIETQCVPMTGARNALLVQAAAQRLGIPASETLEVASLDDLFLEPERSRIMEMTDEPGSDFRAPLKEKVRKDRLFSAAELRNTLLLLEAAYSEFDLAATDFGRASALISNFSRNYVDSDFWIKIPARDLTALFKRMKISHAVQQALVFNGTSFSDCIQSYAPLVRLENTYYSSVTLLGRFAYYWRARCLDRIKRFQIRSGFIFEKAVAGEIAAQGFAIQDIRRINRHEFDVIAVLDGVVWNIQCKNNFMDLAWLEADPSRFARFNYRLVRSYEKALEKDRGREQVLRDALQNREVEHVVVCRFPVVCNNSRILPYSVIGQFRDRVLKLRRTEV